LGRKAVPRIPARREIPHRPGWVPRPGIADAGLAIIGLGFGVTLALGVMAETRGSLAAPGGWLIAGGRLAGLTGSYLMLVMVLLIARIPWIERVVGQERLVRWHRLIGLWPVVLTSCHVVLITLGYAQLAKVGFLRQLWVFLTSYPDLLAAIVGFGLLVMAAVTSIKIVRRRLKYETWWVVHLYTYIALSLAFAHQVVTGGSFVGHPLARVFWIVIWAMTAGLVITFRLLYPIGRSLRHQLRIVSVLEEAPGVFSLVCSGRQLDRLAVSGGQFFKWRFLTRELWWHAHPYSLSAMPRPPYLRVTIKGLGDQSLAATRLRPGTRVAIEGPYGAFTKHARSGDRVVMIAAGVGITPLRALLEDLPRRVEVSVLIRATSAGDIAHREEVAGLVEQRGGRLYEIVGPRHLVRLDADTLRRLVPGIAGCDVYVCGPTGFSEGIVNSALRLGVSRDRIHEEVFAF
jgi:predicted ferric reductase